MRTRGLGRLFVVAAAGLLVHCQPSARGDAGDGATDARDASATDIVDAANADVGAEADVASADADFDAGDVTTDSAVDAADSVVDVVTDVGTDADSAMSDVSAMDAPRDALPDVSTDVASDVTADAGTDSAADGSTAVLRFAAPVTFDLPRGAERVVAADFDGDGRIDVAVSYLPPTAAGVPPGLALLHNRASPGAINAMSFAARVDIPSPRILPSVDIAPGDLDRDGRIDLLATNNGETSIWHNRSAPGSFTSTSFAFVMGGDRGSQGVLTDVDADGDLDLVAGSTVSPPRASLVVSVNNSTTGVIAFGAPATFVSTLGVRITAIDAADLDGDSRPDIAAAGSFTAGTGQLLFYRNTTSGTTVGFATPVNRPFASGEVRTSFLRLADLNADMRPDLVLSSVSVVSPDSAWIGTHTGMMPFGLAMFAPEVSVGVGSRVSLPHFAIGRLDRDVRPDLAAVSATYAYGWVNRTAPGAAVSSATFPSDPGALNRTGNDTRSVGIADIDGDGLADLLVVKRESTLGDGINRLFVMRNITP